MMLPLAVSESEITTRETASEFSMLRVTVVTSKTTGSVTVSVKESNLYLVQSLLSLLDNNFHYSLEE